MSKKKKEEITGETSTKFVECFSVRSHANHSLAMGSGGHRHQRPVDSHLISWAPPRFFLYPSDCLGWPLKSPSAWRWSLRRLPGPLGSLLSSPPPLVSASRSRSDYRGSTAPSRPAFGGPWRPLRRRLRHHPVAARRSRQIGRAHV